MLCPTCGAEISSKYEAYTLLSDVIVSTQGDSDNKHIDPTINQNLEAVFKALRIRKLCTRMHMVSTQNIYTFSNK
jgi:DNA-directed RNA polymerase subunit N (RpoN/RPB10)